MSDADCREARERLALGEDLAAAEHLRTCPECRREAESLRRVVAALAAVDLRLAPPAWLDAAVRARLGAGPPARSVLRPVPAFALALGSIVAFFLWLSSMFVQGGQGPRSLTLAVGITVLYLAVCCAATVPLLIHRTVPLGNGVREVRP